jgi:hypothetical protein
MLPVALACGIVMSGAGDVRAAEKTFVLTGLVDCGIGSGTVCPASDTVTLVTEDVGPRQRVAIDISWIRAQFEAIAQDDQLCIEVSGANGTYQALSVASCSDGPAPKHEKPDDAPEEIY